MKKNLLKLIITMSILIIIPYSCITALGKIDWTTEGDKALYAHPEFINIEEFWGEKLGTHYLVNLTENRMLEFSQIDSRNGGGKYAGLKRIGEFEVREDVRYIDEKGQPFWGDWKDAYGSYVRFRDLSQEMSIKIETMTDVIDHYDEILDFVKKIANEQYISNDYVYRLDSGDRKAAIWVSDIHGYSYVLWHGVKEDEMPPYNEYFGPGIYDIKYGENWREKLNADLPKIRKSLGLEN